ncbi:MAG: DUF4037 domain-containing protein [Candidatus Latescibacterota bacterium]
MRDQTLQKLIASYREDASGDSRTRWIAQCGRFFASPERPSVLTALSSSACVVLHGSTTRNVDDGCSDLDFYLLLDDAGLALFDSACATRFVDVSIDGKAGHLNPILFDDVRSAFAQPDLETIYELQHAVPVLDPSDRFAALRRRAMEPMSESIRRAALMFNYMEMRRFHRSADNPLDRHDELAALSNVVDTINSAIRCAIILDGRAYPYAKWLYVAASGLPMGALVLEQVDHILHLIRTNPSALKGPERDNEISKSLRRMRTAIVDRAKATGIDEPWLTQWWHFFAEQKSVFDGVAWSV